jgi:hypothetical protein
MNDETRRALLARLAALSAAGYVAPRAIVIDPAAAAKGKCPPSPFGKGKGPCK